MIRKIWLLVVNDAAVAFRNKTVYLMCFVPLFVVFVLSVVDNTDSSPARTRLGLIRGAAYPQAVVDAVRGAEQLFSLVWVDSEDAAKAAVAESALDGVLVRDADSSTSSTLLVAKRYAVSTLTMAEGLAQLQRQVESRSSWVSQVSSLTAEKGMQRQTMTIWILMLVLLVGFMVLPPQIAEEKEKKLLLGLLQAPVREGEWLAAKVITGMGLALLPIAMLHATTGTGVAHPVGYAAMLLAGCFCFSAMGAVLGLACKSQGSARALGVVFYLPHLLPSALADFSKTLSTAAVFVPSYQFFTPLRAMILDDASLGRYVPQAVLLTVGGALCCAAASLILRRRWMM